MTTPSKAAADAAEKVKSYARDKAISVHVTHGVFIAELVLALDRLEQAQREKYVKPAAMWSYPAECPECDHKFGDKP